MLTSVKSYTYIFPVWKKGYFLYVYVYLCKKNNYFIFLIIVTITYTQIIVIFV